MEIREPGEYKILGSYPAVYFSNISDHHLPGLSPYVSEHLFIICYNYPMYKWSNQVNLSKNPGNFMNFVLLRIFPYI